LLFLINQMENRKQNWNLYVRRMDIAHVKYHNCCSSNVQFTANKCAIKKWILTSTIQIKAAFLANWFSFEWQGIVSRSKTCKLGLETVWIFFTATNFTLSLDWKQIEKMVVNHHMIRTSTKIVTICRCTIRMEILLLYGYLKILKFNHLLFQKNIHACHFSNSHKLSMYSKRSIQSYDYC